LEDNDILYLQDDELINDQMIKNLKKKQNELNIKGELNSVYKKFCSCSTYLKINILDFCDVFSVGKFGLVNKFLYEFIFKNYHFEKISKQYCMAIFKNSNLYINQQDKIFIEYKTYFTMLKQRPRIFFSGIYYSRVKFCKVGENFGQSDRSIITVFYFRILRFMPNGEVHCLTCPNIKNKKLIQQINKNSINLKKGRFYIDENNNINIEIKENEYQSYIYKYKVKNKIIFKMRINLTKFLVYLQV
jgi:F-box only protein C-terminal region